jgi:hypothetical protein
MDEGLHKTFFNLKMISKILQGFQGYLDLPWHRAVFNNLLSKGKTTSQTSGKIDKVQQFMMKSFNNRHHSRWSLCKFFCFISIELMLIQDKDLVFSWIVKVALMGLKNVARVEWWLIQDMKLHQVQATILGDLQLNLCNTISGRDLQADRRNQIKHSILMTLMQHKVHLKGGQGTINSIIHKEVVLE